MSRRPVLVLHGGTGSHPTRKRLLQIRESLRAICEEAYSYLQSHCASETAVFAVRRLEDDPLFNAGTGSMLQQDGKVRMSASVMDGSRMRFAAVLNIERVKNPIVVAQALLDEADRVLAGAEATRFARSLGFASWNPVTPARLRRWRRAYGTVGALALDYDGRLAAATSTGGRGFERAGRVSDSGMPVGNYADEQLAISCTGIGEEIIDEGLAIRIAQRIQDGATLQHVFARTFRELKARRRSVGAIGLDRDGRFAWVTTLPVLFAVTKTTTRLIASC